MTRHSENGMVMTMSTMERKVRTMAAKPGPSGSAERNKKGKINSNIVWESVFLHRICFQFRIWDVNRNCDRTEIERWVDKGNKLFFITCQRCNKMQPPPNTYCTVFGNICPTIIFFFWVMAYFHTRAVGVWTRFTAPPPPASEEGRGAV